MKFNHCVSGLLSAINISFQYRQIIWSKFHLVEDTILISSLICFNKKNQRKKQNKYFDRKVHVRVKKGAHSNFRW